MLNKKFTSLVLVLGVLIGSAQTSLCCAKNGHSTYIVNQDNENSELTDEETDFEDDDYFGDDMEDFSDETSGSSLNEKIFLISLTSSGFVNLAKEVLEKKYIVTPKKDNDSKVDEKTPENKVDIREKTDEVDPPKTNYAGNTVRRGVTNGEENNAAISSPGNKNDHNELQLDVPQKILVNLFFSPYRFPSIYLASKALGVYDEYSKMFDAPLVYHKDGKSLCKDYSFLQIILFLYITMHSAAGLMVIYETFKNREKLSMLKIIVNVVKSFDPLLSGVIGLAKGIYDGKGVSGKVGLGIFNAITGAWAFGKDIIDVFDIDDGGKKDKSRPHLKKIKIVGGDDDKKFHTDLNSRLMGNLEYDTLLF